MSSRDGLSYRQKMLQANKEAKATLVALVLCIVVWAIGGFGLAGLDIEVFGTPVWIIGGTIGTWVFSIAAAVFLAKRVFADFDLDEEEEARHE
ncbi:MAG: YhdT family protein [Slackia sp.]|nr:YhdT family protein [Slackia sp.]